MARPVIFAKHVADNRGTTEINFSVNENLRSRSFSNSILSLDKFPLELDSIINSFISSEEREVR